MAVVYLPFDLPGNVEKFIDVAQTQNGDYSSNTSFWGNYSTGVLPTRYTGIYSVGMIPSRPGVFQAIAACSVLPLGCFEAYFVQMSARWKLLAGIGVENVTVAGDTRFDRVTAVEAKRRDIP